MEYAPFPGKERCNKKFGRGIFRARNRVDAMQRFASLYDESGHRVFRLLPYERRGSPFSLA